MENNTKTLVCKEKAEYGRGNGEVGKINAYGAGQSQSEPRKGNGPDVMNQRPPAELWP